jgi:hypothetical protein
VRLRREVKSPTYRHKARKSLALNPKFQNETFPAAGILASGVHHQGLGAMNLVANVMLGNSAAPTSGKTAGKTAGGDFAAWLQFREAVAGEVPDQAGSVKSDPGNKKEQSDAKQSELASQLAALNIPIFLPQAAPLAAIKTASPGTGDSLNKTKQVSDKHVAQDVTGQIASAKPNVDSLLNVGAATNTTHQAAAAEELLKPVAQPETEPPRVSASKLGSDGAGHPNLNSEAISRIAAKQPATKTAETKQGEKAEVPQQKAPEAVRPADSKIQNLIHPPDGVTALAAKPIHAIESLASSAVKIALKQALPAQSKLATTSATAALPSVRAFAASQTGDGHRLQNNSSHPALAAHESQPAQDQTKKQTDAAVTAAQSGVDTQSRDQVNAAERVVSSALNTESPKQSPGTAAPGGTAATVKQEIPIHETPAAVSNPLSLHSARLLESLGQSELRVGLKMGDLGNVEIRTQLHHDQLRAEISVERGDLGHTLAAEMPALQQRLRDHDVPMASIVVNHQAAAGSGSFERGSQQQQQMATPMSHVFGVEPMISSSSPEETRVTHSALDIRI